MLKHSPELLFILGAFDLPIRFVLADPATPPLSPPELFPWIWRSLLASVFVVVFGPVFFGLVASASDVVTPPTSQWRLRTWKTIITQHPAAFMTLVLLFYVIKIREEFLTWLKTPYKRYEREEEKDEAPLQLSPCAAETEEEQLTLFLTSCLYGKREQLRTLIDGGQFGINTLCPVTGFNGLHVACRRDQRSVVQLLIARAKKSLDLNCPNGKGRTPVVIAAKHGFDQIVKDLLAEKRINLGSGVGEAAILAAVKKDHFKVAETIADRMTDLKIEFADKYWPSYISRIVEHQKDLLEGVDRLSEEERRKKEHYISYFKSLLVKDHKPNNNNNIVQSDLNCPICEDSFNEEIVRCSNDHWFCEVGVKKMIDLYTRSKKKDEKYEYKCPTCREDFVAHPPRRSAKVERVAYLMARKNGDAKAARKKLLIVLKCFMCRCLLEGKILRCSRDHWFCQECLKGVEYCPECEESFAESPPKRCFTVENVVQIVRRKIY